MAVEGRGDAYEAVLAENLPALLREVHVRDADLPPLSAPPDLDAQGPPDDLVAEADADDAHPVLRQQLPHEVHEL